MEKVTFLETYLLETYKPTRSLRSSSRSLLVIPRSKLKSYGDRAFSASAPKLWNDVPKTINSNAVLILTLLSVILKLKLGGVNLHRDLTELR